MAEDLRWMAGFAATLTKDLMARPSNAEEEEEDNIVIEITSST